MANSRAQLQDRPSDSRISDRDYKVGVFTTMKGRQTGEKIKSLL